MKLNEWFRPGIRVKRWLFLGILGIACISFGISFTMQAIYVSLIEKVMSFFLILSGMTFMFLSIRNIVDTFFQAISNTGFKLSLDANRLSGLLYEKRILINGPKIVTVGGGTGLSTMLRGLKAYSSNLTAVVTVADDGGGSGMLRTDLGILPPGDIRNCILALADTEPIMQKLLQYRFSEGVLKGQSFGNLFLAAMDGISTNFEEAVRKMSDVLAVTGKVLPVTLEDMKICARLADGTIVHGESNIGKHHTTHPGRIESIFLEPPRIMPLTDSLTAIAEADIIVLGPGSLYTSILPNLLVDGICDAIKNSPAIKVYVCNVMTQPGETEGYSVSDHVNAIISHTYEGIVDYCIVNIGKVPEELLVHYHEDGADVVRIDRERMEGLGITLIQKDILRIGDNLVRHDPDKLAEVIMDLVAEKVLANDKKRILDYYYVKDRLSVRTVKDETAGIKKTRRSVFIKNKG